MIGLIHEDLLKSAELTGIWEKKLREIERRKYEARQFLEEMKKMVSDIVATVISDNRNRRVAAAPEVQPKAGKGSKLSGKKAVKKPAATQKTETSGVLAPSDTLIGQPCPLCGKGKIIKGKTAYGCSERKEGCGWRQTFS